MSTTPVRSNEAALGGQLISWRDVKTLGLASLGGALEYYDFIVAVFFTKLLATALSVTESETVRRQV
jgi:hypothetical protein